MNATLILLAALTLPLLRAVLAVIAPRPPGLRDSLQFLLALAHLIAALMLFDAARNGVDARLVLAQPLPQVGLSFAIEPLGALFVLLIAGLGFLHTIHSAAFLRVTREAAPARMQAFMALSAFAASALALSSNLFSFFVAAQALTLATFPLVAHAGDDESRAASRIYLATLLTASVGLLLPAMVWTYALTGQLEFRPGGIFARPIDPISLNALLALFVLGVAQVALAPMHRWLPASSTAPFPGIAMIQGVAVTNAGGIGVLKIATYVFGVRLAEAQIAAQGLIALAGVAMVAASMVALSKKDLREQLAYSMIAQSAAVVMGALIALPTGTFAAALQIVAQALAATTMAMACAGVFAGTGRVEAKDYEGLGRIMPFTITSFAIAAASLIGIPPFSGAWARLWLVTATADAGYLWASGFLVLAAVLAFAHWGPRAASALAGPRPADPVRRPDGASILMVAPVVIGAGLTLSLMFLADPLARFLSTIWRGGS